MSVIETLRTLTPQDYISGELLFDALDEATDRRELYGESDVVAGEILIRILDAKQKGQVNPENSDVINLFLHEFGYYPYVDESKLIQTNAVIQEAHKVSLGKDVYLHTKQMEIFLYLLSKRSVILSAPTSFGKTLLVDAYISYVQPKVVALIFPTLALIDECRRRLKAIFGEKYRFVTHPDEAINLPQNVIYIMTQERFNSLERIPKLDFFFVDEFYLVDRPEQRGSRAWSLNLAIYRGVRQSIVSFMAGPFVDHVILDEAWSERFAFIQSDFRTVTVNQYNRSEVRDKYTAFLSDLKNCGTQPGLVFCSSPDSARNLLANIVRDSEAIEGERTLALAEWVAQHYHRGWNLVDALRHGFGLHHGRMPRSLAQLAVRMFDNGDINTLLCTSTLLSGVNTKAANVFVYDQKINKKDLDFFDFSNIKGRVGRMMSYFVGNVYIYQPQPEPVENIVHIDALSDINGSSEYLITNVDDEDLDDTGLQRREDIFKRINVDRDVIRRHLSLGFDTLESLVGLIEQRVQDRAQDYFWSGLPDKEKRIALAALYVDTPGLTSKGVYTQKQIAWAWDMLFRCRTLSKFLRWFVRTFEPNDENAGVERAFQFLSCCEFDYPRLLFAAAEIIDNMYPDSHLDWSYFLSAMENWNRPKWMKRLDEFGVPIPLAEKYMSRIGPDASVDDALAFFRRLKDEESGDVGEGDWMFLNLALE